ncbi:4,5-DOPA dioxygenase extradiol [Corynebacterium breve]|uniref:4,5-DOPA dioxygenase extradiol n=1 Tax=Corynebacterium breve TaxID=3049799 RepID=A0ABY8VJ89_9CORY|nr:4,5-DOPA dioxygenase extradiol [Corynebacterium breve]WIM68830.1 4,5-DOPA dioxygenase extradiol [Corynebacterium breve]
MTTQALFVGHGSPMNAIEDNDFTRTWAELGKGITPRAIVSVSAHWYTRGTGVTAMTDPKTIHDFWGFPPELNAVEYNAPGDPEIAELVSDIAKPTMVAQDYNWGLDHGTWSVLKHMFPEANIPVVQLSIDGTQPLEHHVALGTRLARLAQENDVLIVGSGNVVHNLSMVQWHAGNTGFDWADAFDEDAAELMKTDPERLAALTDHEAYSRAVPTPDHFLPLAYVAGVTAALDNATVEEFNKQRTMGSLSMTGFAVHSAA